MEQSDIHIRYRILQNVYRGIKDRNTDSYPFIPDLLGYTYSEANYQLRYMKSRGFLTYAPRLLMRHYTITLLPPGREAAEQLESAFFSDAPDREERMEEALALLK